MLEFAHRSIVMLGAIGLALAGMFLFFGGTWGGVRLGLEIIGGIAILQIAYNALLESGQEKQKAAEAKEIEKKYFS